MALQGYAQNDNYFAPVEYRDPEKRDIVPSTPGSDVKGITVNVTEVSLRAAGKNRF